MFGRSVYQIGAAVNRSKKAKAPKREPSQGVIEAAFLARDWHGGQASALYALSCGQWDHLTKDNYLDAAEEFESIIRSGHAGEDEDQMREAVAALKRQARPVAAKRNPHCNPSKRGRPSKIDQRDYTHYVVDVRSDRINTGWSYPEDAKEAKKDLERDFSSLRGALKVLTRKGLIRKGIDPKSNASWRELPEVANMIPQRSNPAKRRVALTANPRPARATVRHKVRRNPSAQVHGSRGHDRLEMAEHEQKSGRTFWAVVYAAQAASDLEDAGYHKDADKALRMVHRLTGM